MAGNGNSNGNGVSKALVDAKAHEVFKNAGFLKEDDNGVDYQKVRERILEIASQQKVLSKRERSDKATLRTSLMEELFGDALPDPDDTDNAKEALLRAEVYKRLDAKIWEQTRPSADGPVQRLVGLNMGNGYVLCRTKIGKARADAIYITDNIECIRLDFTRPDNASFNNKAALVTANREMLIIRQPHNAKKYIAEYDKTFDSAYQLGMGQLNLAALAANADNNDDTEDEGEE